jgi:hypothetical protein
MIKSKLFKEILCVKSLSVVKFSYENQSFFSQLKNNTSCFSPHYIRNGRPFNIQTANLEPRRKVFPSEYF